MSGRGRHLSDLQLIPEPATHGQLVIDPNVRAAVADDVDQLRLLEREARQMLVDQRGGRRWLETHPERAAGWPGQVTQDFVAVAHIGEVLVGYLAMSTAGTIARIDEVFVAPQARENGFGDALLALALEHARVTGVSTVEGESLPGDRDTKNLYERAGIKARLITVSIDL